MNPWEKFEGTPSPLGATWVEEDQAWNFSLYSKNASAVTLLLFSDQSYVEPIFRYEFHPLHNKSAPIWHCRVPHKEVADAKYYAYRVTGPQQGRSGWHCFDPQKLLLDPYAKGVFFPPAFSRKAACLPGANDGEAPLGVLIGKERFDWVNDRLIKHGSDLIVYEMHVRGFTRAPTSGVAPEKRGTFAGVTEKIPYLVELGVTAVELMPVFQFDPQQGNYWGYMTLNFFAPHQGYCSSDESRRQRQEFREMVKALHDAGIEVILDVVYNHTAEGDEREPVYSFKGLDNSSYYIPSRNPSKPYANLSGCGNTLDASSIIVRRLIVDSLVHWRDEMHVDGFRFDLASVFSYNHAGGDNNAQAPIFGQIRTSRELQELRMIAEPWDAAGTYQLGRAFPGWLWMQWNGKYRDTVQAFVRGDRGMIAELMTRIYGSSDLFPDDLFFACRPWQSVNYISSHDGSSLYDLVSYERKNNWANGEDNRDGCSEFKWNCGWEGDENLNPEILALRKQQVKNMFAILFLSNGTPMFRMGDEFCQTQGGNNNPYNQDNQTSWLDWSRLAAYQDVFRFVKMLIRFRKTHPSLSRSHFWRDDVKWHGYSADVDFSAHSRHLAFFLRGDEQDDNDLYVMISAESLPLEFQIQGAPRNWRVALDTSLPSPRDIAEPAGGEVLGRQSYMVQARSVVVLVAE